jgi:hypothetical protein
VRLFACLAALAAASPIPAQKLETQPSDATKVIRVETARDQLTVIEVGDPITMVAVGNQNAYMVERRENKVFIRPAEDDAHTNLFIWTRQGRFAYELVPAAGVDRMHFAIDHTPRVVAVNSEPTALEILQTPAPAEMLLRATPVSVHGERETRRRVEVTVRDLCRADGRLFLRYAIHNRSAGGYHPARPAVWRMAGVQSATSLIPFRDSQLGEKLARSVKASSLAPVIVINAGQPAYVAAGESAAGWLVVEEPGTAGGPTPVLRLEFAADVTTAVHAVLVLSPIAARAEVADATGIRSGNR